MNDGIYGLSGRMFGFYFSWIFGNKPNTWFGMWSTSFHQFRNEDSYSELCSHHYPMFCARSKHTRWWRVFKKGQNTISFLKHHLSGSWERFRSTWNLKIEKHVLTCRMTLAGRCVFYMWSNCYLMIVIACLDYFCPSQQHPPLLLPPKVLVDPSPRPRRPPRHSMEPHFPHLLIASSLFGPSLFLSSCDRRSGLYADQPRFGDCHHVFSDDGWYVILYPNDHEVSGGFCGSQLSSFWEGRACDGSAADCAAVLGSLDFIIDFAATLPLPPSEPCLCDIPNENFHDSVLCYIFWKLEPD